MFRKKESTSIARLKKIPRPQGKAEKKSGHDYDIRTEDKLGLISTPEKLKYPNLMMLNIRKECLTPEK